MTTLFRTPLSLLAAFATVASLAGCGNEEPDPNQLIREAFSASKAIKSGRLDAKVDLDARGLERSGGPLSLKLAGPFQSHGRGKLPDFELQVSLGGPQLDVTVGLVSAGGRGFFEVLSSAYEVPSELFGELRKGFEGDSGASEQPTLATLGIDPTKWLKGARLEGTTTVDGTETVHVGADVDVPAFLKDLDQLLVRAASVGGGLAGLPSRLTGKQRAVIADSVTRASVDVYSGKDDRILRRLTFALAFDVPAARRVDAGGLENGKVAVDLQFSEVNEPQEIAVPSNPKPFTDLVALLQRLGLGDAVGAGGAPGGLDAYVDCLTDAAGDPARATKCAELLSR